jgi:RNA polymerase sigma-70 factor (ECF subfamily)
MHERVVMPEPSLVERVYRERGARLWRALVAFTGDRDVASDAVAEAFAQLLRRGDDVRTPERWVWAAAFRIATAEMGRRRRTLVAVGAEPRYELPEPVDDLVAALSELPRAQRLAVVLHDYGDRPTAEVASILGVTRTTVHVHLSRGRKRLRELLGDPADG